ncbi:hypothetical protein IMG5_120720 [Ichthyophthirius multifiliis]|uniref:V-SNARE coiled-coil homology domain-containing protein n=1 Tax=Ichthyophthirius multifiliis TaxID=5932 RepID=G0QV15_ICHMU|nr:hypothetical protein IMG5_120720 [Ichthyophthirius multifiliis]EGR30940.1 hypothetical protein IMG5_120720 [Ichthyophthirius multifiliis]|eukprot:XP_004032527.1 hypothetical protein IMG5_120720 [Ichthyophthirius multifiliis]
MQRIFGWFIKGTRHKVKHDSYIVYIQMSANHQVGAFAFVESEYPSEGVIYGCLSKSLDAFFQKITSTWQSIQNDDKIDVQQIQQYIKEYQDVRNVDKLASAQSKVDEINVILHQNIKQLLANQGDLDQLVEKSKDLNKASKTLYKQSKGMKQSCCIIF